MKNLFVLLAIVFALGFAVLTGCPGPMGLQGAPGEDGKDGKDNPGVFLQYYTVGYDANGGDGEMENSSFAIGFLGRLRINAFTNEGFVFTGWSTAAEGPPEYADWEAVEDLSTTPNDTVTLYAVWGPPNSYTVSYNASGGTGYMPPSVFTLWQVYTLPANAYTRTGYTFEGWSIEEDGQVIFSNSQNIISITPNAGETVYLYAVWKLLTYTVKYDANGGTGAMDLSVFTYDEPQALRKNVFTNGDHAFAGWSSSAQGEAEYTDGQVIQNITDIAWDTITLYAVWRYSVTFDADNHSPPAIVYVNKGSPVSQPADPVKMHITESGLYAGTEDGINFNFTFNGWYYGNSEWDFNTPVTENIVLTAQWIMVSGNTAIDLSGISGDTVIDKAFSYVNANADISEYTLLIAQDISLSGSDARILNQSNARLTIFGPGNAERQISLSSTGRMFTISGTDISLTLGNNITLVGLPDNISDPMFMLLSPVLDVRNNAVLIMRGNSKITGNNGDGVRIDSRGSFTMQDYASVSGNLGTGVANDGNFTMRDNSSVSGNSKIAVRIYRGSFTMHGNSTVSDNSDTGVYVLGGSFIMYDNSSVSGNTNTSVLGGGVCISAVDFYYNSNFIMRDNARVSGNTARVGGGVFVEPNGGDSTFIMRENASVYGNTAEREGGGIFVWGGRFLMAGGRVYGNEAQPAALRNTANEGAALYKLDGTTQYGSIEGIVWLWNSAGDLPSSDLTIKVVDGELQ